MSIYIWPWPLCQRQLWWATRPSWTRPGWSQAQCDPPASCPQWPGPVCHPGPRPPQWSGGCSWGPGHWPAPQTLHNAVQGQGWGWPGTWRTHPTAGGWCPGEKVARIYQWGHWSSGQGYCCSFLLEVQTLKMMSLNLKQVTYVTINAVGTFYVLV